MSVKFFRNFILLCVGLAVVVASTPALASSGSMRQKGTFERKIPSGVKHKVQRIYWELPQVVYSLEPLRLTTSASSGLKVSAISATPTICQIQRSKIFLLQNGECLIRATQAGNKNFGAAPKVTIKILVDFRPKSQEISFHPVFSLNASQMPYGLFASSSSGLPVLIFSNDLNVCYVDGSYLLPATATSFGNCSLTAVQPGNNEYLAADPVNVTIAINQPRL
jgi:hypothetical protein